MLYSDGRILFTDGSLDELHRGALEMGLSRGRDFEDVDFPHYSIPVGVGEGLIYGIAERVEVDYVDGIVRDIRTVKPVKEEDGEWRLGDGEFLR